MRLRKWCIFCGRLRWRWHDELFCACECMTMELLQTYREQLKERRP